jgi:pimeloyl-ACP methyl ester carboxylesterase
MSSLAKQVITVKLSGVDIEVERRGSGPPLLVLYGEEALELNSTVLDHLAGKYELIIPSPPGFGHSQRPDWITIPDDISYIYLDLVDHFKLHGAPVIGFGLGGWLAFEMATKSDFASKIVVVDPYGVKVGGPTDRDIQDIWTLHPRTVEGLKWHDTAKAKRDFASMTDDELAVVARNVETFARFCWEPYMHNPKLKHRLHRVTAPTLFVWGANDGIMTTDYGRAYAALVKGSRFEVIANAGHYPHLEQPEAFLKVVTPFIG